MSYTKLVKKWELEYQKKSKIALQQWKEKQERKERIEAAIICSELMEGIKKQRKHEELIKIKDSIILALRSNNPFTYPQYLIMWNMIIINDYQQIEIDLYKGKITKDDITKVLNYIKSFSAELINEYWNNKLLEV